MGVVLLPLPTGMSLTPVPVYNSQKKKKKFHPLEGAMSPERVYWVEERTLPSTLNTKTITTL